MTMVTMTIPSFPPPPRLDRSGRIARRVALSLLTIQAIVAFAAAGAGVLYVGAASSSSNQSPLAGIAVVLGLGLIGFGVVVGVILVWAARLMKADARRSVGPVATAEVFVVFLGLWGGSLVGLLAIATGGAVLFCTAVIRSDEPGPAAGA